MKKSILVRGMGYGMLIAGIMAGSIWAAEEAETAGEAGDIVVATDLLQTTVPAEIAAICDIEAMPNSLAFFEKISHKDYSGGFAGSLQLYESVKDYGYLPHFERVGELTLADGTRYNVIAEYASDVQFDPQNEESTANYRTLCDAFDEIIVPGLTPVNAGDTFIPQEETDTQSIFQDVLTTLAADLEAQKDREGLEADGFSYMYAYSYAEGTDAREKIGYTYTDIDYDGYCELLIGEIGQKEIYDMFTQVDGEVHHLITGGERDRWYLTGDEYGYRGLKNEGSGGAEYSVDSFYDLIAGDEQYLQVSFVYDGTSDPENPWKIDYGFGDVESVSEEEWRTRMGYNGENMELDYQPLG